MNADLYRVAFAVARHVAIRRRAFAFAIARHVSLGRRIALGPRTVARARHVIVEKGSPNEPALHRDDAPRPAVQSLGHAQHDTPTLRRTQTNPARPRRPRG